MNVPLYKTYSDESDVEAVSGVIRRQTRWAEGPSVERFEADLCSHLSAPGALACNSGTAALHMALLAIGVKHWHEVIVPSFTFIATANAVRYTGAHPTFADIEEDTYGLDPKDVAAKIVPGRTKAIIAVHPYGRPCKIREIADIARRNSIALIEDACEALGAKVDGMPVGKFGVAAAFSFCANKVISTGEGGALVTSDKYLYDRARIIRSHGRDKGGVNQGEAESYVSLGYNYRMSDMAGALGASQLVKIEKLIAMRRQVAQWYCQRLGLEYHPESVYQLFTIRTTKRDALMRHLRENGIGCKVYFNPIHLTEFYRRYTWKPPILPVTERVSPEVLSLPMYPALTEAEVDYVCQKVKEVL